MHFIKIVIGLGLATITAAKSSTLYFTNASSSVQAGQPVVLKYMAPDMSKVTTLQSEMASDVIDERPLILLIACPNHPPPGA